MPSTGKVRAIFSSRAASLLSLIGVAIGLGNVWRFPYMMGSYGGSAFLVVYLLFTLLFAIPALTAELALGRYCRKGPVGAFAHAAGPCVGPLIGYILLLTVLVADSYYMVVIAYVAYSAWFSLAHGFAATETVAFHTGLADGSTQYSIALGLLIASLFIIHRGLKRGIELVSKFFVPFFWLATILLIIGALRLPGAWHQLAVFLHPDFSSLTFTRLFAAMGQAFFSLGLGGTFMLVYGSYIASDTSITSTAILTAIGNSGASLLVALFIVPTILVFGLNMAAGPTLLFSTLPQLFHQLPYGEYFGSLFLVGLTMVAFLSSLAALEVLYASVADLPYGKPGHPSALFVIGLLEAVLMLPSAFHPEVIAILDLVFGSGMQALGSAMAVLAITWGLGKRITLEQLFGSAAGIPQNLFFHWLRWVVPAALIFLLCSYVYGMVA